MTRSILSGLLGLLSVAAMASLPSACESGGVGDPCVPEDEYNPQFAGFKVTEENIESRSFQCQTRICLVNHFQGRVSCPMGQAAPVPCRPDAAGSCAQGECVQAGTFAAACDPNAADGGSGQCGGRTCDPKGGYCRCTDVTDCPSADWYCDSAGDGQCKSFVCHDKSKGCQDPSRSDTDNEGKACCIPGTDEPVAQPVCGQCADGSNRNAEQAVYCSCRCGVADGEPEDPNFNFCTCPKGFVCEEIRPNLGLGDEKITGKYCIKEGSTYRDKQDCGRLAGEYNPSQCDGYK